MTLGIFQRTVTDDAGDVQAAASVEVRVQDTNALASIYSDRAGSVPLANPFTTGSDGLVKFFAEGNAYKITATKGAFSVVWEYVAIGTAQELDIGAIEELIAEAGGTPELAEIATQRLLANISGSPAAPVENTLTAILDNIIGNTQGSIIARNAVFWGQLGPGTNGQYLRTNGAGANPTWDTPPGPTHTTVTLASDQSRTSTTTSTAITGLSFAADASSVYLVRVVLYMVTSAGGARWNINVSSAPTLGFKSIGTPSGAADALGTDNATTAAAGNWVVEFFAYIETNGAATIAIHGAQAASNGSASTFKRGSFIEYRKVS
jgi:hypothetical protein